MSKWYYSREGKAEGPVEESFLLNALRTGSLSLIDLVFQAGDDRWHAMSEIEKFRTVIERKPLPPPPPTEPIAQKSTSSDEPSWIVLQGSDMKSGEETRFESRGPFSNEQIQEMLQAGSLSYSDYAWREGYLRWARIGNIKEFDRRHRQAGPRAMDQLASKIPLPYVQMVNQMPAEELLKNVVRMPPYLSPAAADPEPLEKNLGPDLLQKPIAYAPPVTPASSVAPVMATPAAAITTASPIDINARQEQNVDLVEKSTEKAVEKDHFKAEDLTKKPHVAIRKRAQAQESGLLPENSIPAMATPHSWKRRLLFVGVGAIVCTAVIVFLMKPSAHPKETDALKTPATSKNPAPVVAMTPPPDPNLVANSQNHLESSLDTQHQNTSMQTSAAPSSAQHIELMALKLETAPQIVVQTDAPAGAEIHLEIHGRSGKILRYPSYYKELSLVRSNGEVPNFDLSSLNLPSGTYQVEASSGDLKRSKTVFIGQRDKAFSDAMERYLKVVAYEQQHERKALYYTAKKYEALAQDLNQGFQKNHAQLGSWRSYYHEWMKKFKASNSPLLARIQPETSNEFAYPDEFSRLKEMVRRLHEHGDSLNLSIEQKRAVAADVSAAGLAKEFAKIKTRAAQISSRR